MQIENFEPENLPILIRQSQLEGLTDMLLGVAIMLCGLMLFKKRAGWMLNVCKSDSGFISILLYLGMGICFFIGLLLATIGFKEFANPEYYALEQALGLAGG